jgi:hypothetical protein
VVKLTLLPVVNVLPAEWLEAIQDAFEAQGIGKLLDRCDGLS